MDNKQFEEDHKDRLRDNRRKIEKRQKIIKALIASAPYLIGAIVLSIVLYLVTYEPPKPVKYFLLLGIPIGWAIPSVLLVCLGIAWVFHGFQIRLLA